MKKLIIYAGIVFYLTSCNKTDPENNIITIKKDLSSSNYGIANHSKMLLTNDNFIFIIKDDGVLCKTDISGNIIWQKSFPDTTRIGGERIRQLKDGNFILVGSKKSDTFWNWNYTKSYVAKFDANGDIIWDNEFYPTILNTIYDVQELNNGDLLMLCGHEINTNSIIEQAYIMKVNSKGDSIYSKFFDFELRTYNLEKKLDKFTFIINRLPPEDGGVIYNDDNVLYEIDENGNEIFAKSFSKNLDIQVNGHLVTKENEVFVYGSIKLDNFARKGDIFLSKLDVNGDTIWSLTKNFLEEDKISEIISTSDGGYIAAGITEDESYIIREYIFIMKLNSKGDIMWKKDYKMGSDPFLESIIEVAPGKYRIICRTDYDSMLFLAIE